MAPAGESSPEPRAWLRSRQVLCPEGAQLQAGRPLVAGDEPVPALAVARELTRAGRDHHKHWVRPEPAQREQQGAGRGRVRPVQVVHEQHHELPTAADGVEQAEQLGSGRERVDAVVQAAGQQV